MEMVKHVHKHTGTLVQWASPLTLRPCFLPHTFRMVDASIPEPREAVSVAERKGETEGKAMWEEMLVLGCWWFTRTENSCRARTCHSLGQETVFPRTFMWTSKHYYSPRQWQSLGFPPYQTGLSPYSSKMKTLLTLYYKIDFPSPFHSDNQMKNAFSSDLTPSALWIQQNQI